MKIYIELPGGSIELERQPMSKERFRAVCALVGGVAYAACLVASLEIIGPWALTDLIIALFVWLYFTFAD